MNQTKVINPGTGRPAGFIPVFKPGTSYPKKSIVIHGERLWFALKDTTSMPPRYGHWIELKGTRL